MTFELRRAGVTDARALGRVHAQSRREAYAGIMSADWVARVSDGERIRSWAVRLATGASPWLASVDGEIVGFAASGPARGDDPPRALELYSLYLLESAQGRGLGRALIEAAVGTAPAMLYVLADNERAVRFYRAAGFEFDGHSMVLPHWEGVVDARMVR